MTFIKMSFCIKQILYKRETKSRECSEVTRHTAVLRHFSVCIQIPQRRVNILLPVLLLHVYLDPIQQECAIWKNTKFFPPLELTTKDLLTLVFCLSQNDSLKTHTPPPISCLYYKAYIQVILIQELNRLQKVVPYQLTLSVKKKEFT